MAPSNISLQNCTENKEIVVKQSLVSVSGILNELARSCTENEINVGTGTGQVQVVQYNGIYCD